VVSSRRDILQAAASKWGKGQRVRAVLIAAWICVPLRWAQARQRRVI
jgi:hypothetical protein